MSEYVAGYPVGTLVLMLPTSMWKQERIEKHGSLWIVRPEREGQAQWADGTLVLKSVATGHTVGADPANGVEVYTNREGAEQ